MARRKNSSNPCDLFAFQDIISATIGILLLITCLFSLLKPAAQAVEQGITPVKPPKVAPLPIDGPLDNSSLIAELQQELQTRQEIQHKIKEVEQELAAYIQAEVDRIKSAPLTQGVSYSMAGHESISNYRILLAEGEDLHIYSRDRYDVDAVLKINAFTWMNAEQYLGRNPKIIVLVKPSALAKNDYLKGFLAFVPRENARYEYVSEDTNIVP